MQIGKHEYKGIKVWYDDIKEQWECELAEARSPFYGGDKIEEVRNRIDRYVKEEKKFERFKVINLSRPRGGEKYDILIVTSETEWGEYWTINENKERRLIAPSYLALDTPDNVAIIEEVVEMEARAKALHEKTHELRYSIAMKKDDDE